ncbi:unnamed protein product [Nesidiocoris tenuis]|uniref:Uncharacterized protein n=1 Tax=Nesidiocoris tenuis TaxID=355587 RepID=A0A6H5H7F9_9HEMI|nr:unnamed protein product [Nesidiocoris tenuis]
MRAQPARKIRQSNLLRHFETSVGVSSGAIAALFGCTFWDNNTAKTAGAHWDILDPLRRRIFGTRRIESHRDCDVRVLWRSRRELADYEEVGEEVNSPGEAAEAAARRTHRCPTSSAVCAPAAATEAPGRRSTEALCWICCSSSIWRRETSFRHLIYLEFREKQIFHNHSERMANTATQKDSNKNLSKSLQAFKLSFKLQRQLSLCNT